MTLVTTLWWRCTNCRARKLQYDFIEIDRRFRNDIVLSVLEWGADCIDWEMCVYRKLLFNSSIIHSQLCYVFASVRVLEGVTHCEMESHISTE